jgi:hypothetical protein
MGAIKKAFVMMTGTGGEQQGCRDVFTNQEVLTYS